MSNAKRKLAFDDEGKIDSTQEGNPGSTTASSLRRGEIKGRNRQRSMSHRKMQHRRCRLLSPMDYELLIDVLEGKMDSTMLDFFAPPEFRRAFSATF